MTKHLTTEHGGSSTISLRNKLRNVGQHLKSISVFDFIPSLRHKFGSLPTEAKLFLLICSIFPYKRVIPFEDLAVCIMGLGLFEDVHDMFAARSRIHGIISIINGKKSARKAIVAEIGSAHENDGPHDQHVELLDGAYDLAKSISRNYPLVFHREIIVGKWPESILCKDCYGLSVVLKNVNEYPANLECPKLALLQLKYKEDSPNIPIDFFEEMKELRVLLLDIPSLPQSIKALTNLITLRLEVTKFDDTSSIGGLTNLEFLSISIPSLTDIPREIGQLENLKFLNLRRMNIAYFPPGILSRLLKLEQLHLPLNFSDWGCIAKNYDDHDKWEFQDQDDYGAEERMNMDISEIHDQERINASLVEIASPLLTALQVCIPNVSALPKRSPLFKNIKEFRILKPDNALYQPFGKHSANVLQLTGEVCDIKERGIFYLLRGAEDLNLTQVRNLKSVFCQLEKRGFPSLKKMIVSECDELEYIVDGAKKIIPLQGVHLFWRLECLHLSMLPNLKAICSERWKSLRLFSNLSQINIRFCHKLKYLFRSLVLEDGN